MRNAGYVLVGFIFLYMAIIRPLYDVVDYNLLGGKTRQATQVAQLAVQTAQADTAKQAFDEQVLPKAATLCEATLSQPSQSAVPGAPIGKAVAVETATDNAGHYALRSSHVLDDVSDLAAMRAVICIKWVYGPWHMYQSSKGTPDSQRRTDWDVRVIRWPGGDLLASNLFRGKEPPASYVDSWSDTSYKDAYDKWANSLPK
jgi:hypothetical protein